MYPDWPQSPADLVPLPRCDGPKLSPFDFQGPQKIEFLEHLDEGLHAHVFKVRILGCVYALKVVSKSGVARDGESNSPLDSSASSTTTTGWAPKHTTTRMRTTSRC